MRVLLISFALVVGMAILARAQDPFCPYKEYPYVFCDPNNPSSEMFPRCSADPHREPGLVPMRLHEPFCMVLAMSYDKSIDMSASPGPQILRVYDPQQGQQDMEAAFSEWANLCPSTHGFPTGNPSCCLNIYCSQSELDFSDAVRQHSAGFSLTAENRSGCRIDCDYPPSLIVNFTERFLYLDKDPETNPVVQSWWSGTQSPREDVDEIHGNIYSLRRYVASYLGAMMGLWTLPGSCGNDASVIGTALSEYDYEGLTEDDKCHFMKLYCPHMVGMQPAAGVEQGSGVTGADLSQNFPNPFSTMTAIPYSLAKPGHVRLSLYNAQGEEIRTLLDQPTKAGTYTFGFHADHDTPPGTYWYVLKVDDAPRAQRMILVR